ncbi:MAG: Gx transporter family protein [Candidatus Limiplasma sp.]|nr:Gx transporter family protein [Candidatus Limiplasma sp.]
MRESRAYAQRIALCGLLTTLMLVLGYLESQIPLMPGIPGVKLGLANAVLLYAVYLLSPLLTVGLMLVKVLLSAVLFGNPFALAFSLAGGALSVAGMLLMRRFTPFGVVAISVVGAVLHNAGQVLVALALVGNINILYYAAVLTLVGIGTGILTGVVAGLVMKAGVGITAQAGMKPGKAREGKSEQD